MSDALLSVRGLTTTFATERGALRAVDDVSFDIPAGRTVALVGESGCGKSVTALSILRLLPTPPARVEAGQVLFDGRDLLTLADRDMRRVRGARISMIFQEPMSSLNPVFTVGSQIAEAVQLHRRASRREARDRAVEMLELVGMPDAAARADAYPHQLSGGMRQRVMIAMALSCDPQLLLADEPTTALDVTIQAQILELLQRLQDELGMSILFITHDLGVVAEFAHEVAVMYAGRIVEQSDVRALFRAPRHPYTRGLLASVPPRPTPGAARPTRLRTIPGVVPDLTRLDGSCRFRERCDERALHEDAAERCAVEPALERATSGQAVRCHFAPASLGGGSP